jgi:hypothetical protein
MYTLGGGYLQLSKLLLKGFDILNPKEDEASRLPVRQLTGRGENLSLVALLQAKEHVAFAKVRTCLRAYENLP